MKWRTDKIGFSLGFFGALLLFAIANLISYPMAYSWRISPKIGLKDDGHAFGFPFTSYFVWVGFPLETMFVWPETIVNLVVAVLCSLLAGLLVRKWITSGAPQD